eukprot:CAMPEP_0170374230 /NCGR_PEP_ID=MMETSP0117_2-20130122/10490_1 /TAXON_ID=400756 /ORGANISM="Durinskia baltica, Strain CSIRO CS-38" /LENGTH=96 /DNA_ID=CAMNT_0010629171 /DNA_START=1 /DNA_END=291 /DNA_ORIENTATION=-
MRGQCAKPQDDPFLSPEERSRQEPPHDIGDLFDRLSIPDRAFPMAQRMAAHVAPQQHRGQGLIAQGCVGQEELQIHVQHARLQGIFDVFFSSALFP